MRSRTGMSTAAWSTLVCAVMAGAVSGKIYGDIGSWGGLIYSEVSD